MEGEKAIKKILSVFLCAVMLFSVVPLSASALTENVFSVGPGAEFVDAWRNACLNNGTVLLERNVTIANEYNLESGYEIAVDLNGHSISAAGESADYLFTVCENAKLIITDSSSDKSGSIAVTKLYEDYDTIFAVEEDAVLQLDGGTVYGNSDDDCRLVTVEDGTFIMNGGSLRGNYYDGDGAAVYVNEGSFIMNGGDISDNTAKRIKLSNYCNYGGAVYFDGSSDSVLRITGGTFFNNTADRGGALCLDDGYAEILGGIFSYNLAGEGGAVYVVNRVDRMVFGGNAIISENTADGTDRTARGDALPAGGVFIVPADGLAGDSEPIFSGSVKIKGNSPTDLLTYNYQYMYIADDLDNSPSGHAEIGLSTIGTGAGADFSIVAKNEADVHDYLVCFFAHDTQYTDFEVAELYHGSGIACITIQANMKDMTAMLIDPSAILDEDGDILSSDRYGYEYDPSGCRYTIYSECPVTFAEDVPVLVPKTSGVTSAVTPAGSASSENLYRVTDSYFFLCQNSSVNSLNETCHRNVYYTLSVVTEKTLDPDSAKALQAAKEKACDDLDAFVEGIENTAVLDYIGLAKEAISGCTAIDEVYMLRDQTIALQRPAVNLEKTVKAAKAALTAIAAQSGSAEMNALFNEAVEALDGCTSVTEAETVLSYYEDLLNKQVTSEELASIIASANAVLDELEEKCELYHCDDALAQIDEVRETLEGFEDTRYIRGYIESACADIEYTAAQTIHTLADTQLELNGGGSSASTKMKGIVDEAKAEEDATTDIASAEDVFYKWIDVIMAEMENEPLNKAKDSAAADLRIYAGSQPSEATAAVLNSYIESVYLAETAEALEAILAEGIEKISLCAVKDRGAAEAEKLKAELADYICDEAKAIISDAIAQMPLVITDYQIRAISSQSRDIAAAKDEEYAALKENMLAMLGELSFDDADAAKLISETITAVNASTSIAGINTLCDKIGERAQAIVDLKTLKAEAITAIDTAAAAYPNSESTEIAEETIALIQSAETAANVASLRDKALSDINAANIAQAKSDCLIELEDSIYGYTSDNVTAVLAQYKKAISDSDTLAGVLAACETGKTAVKETRLRDYRSYMISTLRKIGSPRPQSDECLALIDACAAQIESCDTLHAITTACDDAAAEIWELVEKETKEYDEAVYNCKNRIDNAAGNPQYCSDAVKSIVEEYYTTVETLFLAKQVNDLCDSCVARIRKQQNAEEIRRDMLMYAGEIVSEEMQAIVDRLTDELLLNGSDEDIAALVSTCKADIDSLVASDKAEAIKVIFDEYEKYKDEYERMAELLEQYKADIGRAEKESDVFSVRDRALECFPNDLILFRELDRVSAACGKNPSEEVMYLYFRFENEAIRTAPENLPELADQYITLINEQIAKEQSSQPDDGEDTDDEGDEGDVCEKCGTKHKDNFRGKIVCFFRRIINFFANLFH